jgi:hypothetical protein
MLYFSRHVCIVCVSNHRRVLVLLLPQQRDSFFLSEGERGREAFYSIKRNIKHPHQLSKPLSSMVVTSGVHSPTNHSLNGTNTHDVCMHDFAKIYFVYNANPKPCIQSWFRTIPSSIQKITVHFDNHINRSDGHTFHHKALTYREIILEKSPLN